METIKLDHIFNFVPTVLRDKMADDDQIKSWAMQAARSLNFKHFQYVRDIAFVQVTNHKATFPTGLKRIQKVHAFENSTLSTSEVDALYNCCSEDDDFTLYPEGKTFAEACPIYHRLFVTSTFWSNCWEPVKRVQNLTEDYLCKSEVNDCNLLYAYDNQTGIAQFSFKEGLVAVTGYYNNQDSDGDFLLPEEPTELWWYMSKYIESRWLQNRMYMGEQGLTTFYDTARKEETNYRNALRGIWTRMSFNPRNTEAIFSSRFLRHSQILMEHLANLYHAN